MCGIAGIVHFDGRQPDQAALDRMAGQLGHRGPDDRSHWREGAAAFAHTRLSIIDLGGSHQPMVSTDGSTVLAFNGEVLNYQELRTRLDYPFRTQGDTETILAAHARHGDGAPSLLRGQFAYALFDRGTRVLSLVRDPMGILPLFWHHDGHRLLFASEIGALIAGLGGPPALDPSALGAYLTGRSVPAPDTLLTGIRKVRPGHRLTVSARGEVTEVAYWTPDGRPVRSLDPAAAVDELDQLLTTAVRRALVADVPVGSYLSGGVDSSLIAAKVVAEAGHAGVHTYCAEFGDARDADARHADLVSSTLGTTHHNVLVRADDFQDLWGELSRHRGAPLSEPADIAVFRLAEAARHDVTVVLSGEGADELFAGYPKHRLAALTQRAGLIPAGVRGPAFAALERRLPASQRRWGVALRALAEPTAEDRLRGWFAPFTSAERARLLGEAPSAARSAQRGEEESSPLRQMLAADLRDWLPDNLLERGDRMTMAASVELRPPFLDHEVVEFSLGLSPDLLVHHGVGKWLVRQVAARHLPAEVVNRPKSGFRVPLDDWFRTGLSDFARDAVMDPGSVTRAHLDVGEVTAVLDRHASGRRDESIRIWTLASLEVWHRQLLADASCAAPPVTGRSG